MILNAKLLKQSFQNLTHKTQELADIFYQTLFERYPSVKPLFSKTDLSEQKKKLTQTIATIIHGVDQIETLVPAIKKLGLNHNAYQAKEEHYPAVGECLMYALEQTMEDKWNPEIKKAWVDAYEVISTTMIAGSKNQ